jgi:hypothetical protein
MQYPLKITYDSLINKLLKLSIIIKSRSFHCILSNLKYFHKNVLFFWILSRSNQHNNLKLFLFEKTKCSKCELKFILVKSYLVLLGLRNLYLSLRIKKKDHFFFYYYKYFFFFKKGPNYNWVLKN